MSDQGMTLIELLIGTALLVGGGGALVMGMHYGMLHSEYLSEFQVAMNAAQGRLEELASTDLDTLWTGAAFAEARAGTGQCMGLGEDRNCNGVLNAGEDTNGNGVLDEPLAGARLIVQIKASPVILPDDWCAPPPAACAPPTVTPTDPTLLDLHVAACWRTRGRNFGEDVNCNGRLDAGEDVNVNTWADSPAMATTRVGVRE